MVILHPEYPHCGNQRPIQPTIRLTLQRLIRRLKDQSLRMAQIERELTEAITGQRMETTAKERMHRCYIRCRVQVVQTTADAAGIVSAVTSGKCANVVEFAAATVIEEDDIHEGCTVLLTPKVNNIVPQMRWVVWYHVMKMRGRIEAVVAGLILRLGRQSSFRHRRCSSELCWAIRTMAAAPRRY